MGSEMCIRDRLRVGSGGDVSVGGHATNYADSPLEVRGTNAGGDVAIRVTNNSTTAGTQAGVIFTTTTSDFTTAGIGYERGGTADALRFYVGQSDAAGGFDNATERLRIDSSGNMGLGIGGAISDARFRIKGANNTTSSFNDGLMVTSNNETVYKKYSWMGIEAQGGIIFSEATSSLGETMRIDSNGYLSLIHI